MIWFGDPLSCVIRLLTDYVNVIPNPVAQPYRAAHLCFPYKMALFEALISQQPSIYRVLSLGIRCSIVIQSYTYKLQPP
jgi:hypothetical protein